MAAFHHTLRQRRLDIGMGEGRASQLLGLTVMGVLGIVETLVSRVELHDDHILTVALFVRRTYPRSHVTSVSWAKGSPVSIQLEGTNWVHLPNTGHASTKITGAIRAWMNEGP